MTDKPSNVLSSFCDEYMKLYREWEACNMFDDERSEYYLWLRMQDHRRTCEKCLKPKESEK